MFWEKTFDSCVVKECETHLEPLPQAELQEINNSLGPVHSAPISQFALLFHEGFYVLLCDKIANTFLKGDVCIMFVFEATNSYYLI